MDKTKMLKLLKLEANIIWDSLCEMYPKLAKFDCPKISLNGRLYRTAGRCHQENNLIELGTKFLEHSIEYRDIMLNVILPHEIIHQADFNLFGESEKICGHGEKWCEIMNNYGLPASKHHEMDIKK